MEEFLPLVAGAHALARQARFPTHPRRSRPWPPVGLESSRFITGEILHIDGGQVAGH